MCLNSKTDIYVKIKLPFCLKISFGTILALFINKIILMRNISKFEKEKLLHLLECSDEELNNLTEKSNSS